MHHSPHHLRYWNQFDQIWKIKMMCQQMLLVIASLCSYNVEMPRILYIFIELFSPSFHFAAKLIKETECPFSIGKQFYNTLPWLYQPILY